MAASPHDGAAHHSARFALCRSSTSRPRERGRERMPAKIHMRSAKATSIASQATYPFLPDPSIVHFHRRRPGVGRRALNSRARDPRQSLAEARTVGSILNGQRQGRSRRALRLTGRSPELSFESADELSRQKTQPTPPARGGSSPRRFRRRRRFLLFPRTKVSAHQQ